MSGRGRLPANTRLGGYRVLELLGEGGMGAVYAAEDERLGRRVALKVITTRVASNAIYRARFEREARAAAAVTHENVAQVYAAGEDREIPWLALELVPGGRTLATALDERTKLPWREAAALGAQIARALEAIHGAGLVHRDLKPSNALLAANGRVKVTDFGVARGADTDRLTLTGELLGTPHYMSPEQADGKRDVDFHADLYSLGATIFALVAGEPPFEGSGFALVKQHIVDAPRSPRTLAPDVSRALEKLVLRLLAKTPADRGASAAAVALELEAIAAADPVAASGVSRLRTALAATVGLSIVLGGGVAFLSLRVEQATRERASAESERDAARTERDALRTLLAGTAKDAALTPQVLEKLARARKLIPEDDLTGAVTALAGLPAIEAVADIRRQLADAFVAAGKNADAARQLAELSATRPERALALLDEASALDLAPFVADHALAERLRKAAVDELDRQVGLDAKGQAQVERVVLARRALWRARLLIPGGRWLDAFGRLSVLARSTDRGVALTARRWPGSIPSDALGGAEPESPGVAGTPPPGDDWARTVAALDDEAAKPLRLEFLRDALLAQPRSAWLWARTASELFDAGSFAEAERAQVAVHGLTGDADDEMAVARRAFWALHPKLALETFDRAVTHGKKLDHWDEVWRAKILVVNGSGREGLDLMKYVLTVDPPMNTNAGYWFSRAWVAAATDPDEARKCIETARQLPAPR